MWVEGSAEGPLQRWAELERGVTGCQGQPSVVEGGLSAGSSSLMVGCCLNIDSLRLTLPVFGPACLCGAEVIQNKGLEKITVDELVAEITPHGRGECTGSGSSLCRERRALAEKRHSGQARSRGGWRQ